MIIVIRSTKADEVIDGVIQNYKACYPVTNEHEMVVGSAWLTDDPGAANCLVVLDTVEPGALEKWEKSGKHVLTSDWLPAVDIDQVLVVHDLKMNDGSEPPWAFSSLYGETIDDMIGICEEVFFGQAG